jgi:hypothetical protein
MLEVEYVGNGVPVPDCYPSRGCQSHLRMTCLPTAAGTGDAAAGTDASGWARAGGTPLPVTAATAPVSSAPNAASQLSFMQPAPGRCPLVFYPLRP